MTSAKSTSWEKELRKNICTNFGRGIRVNGENSGRTKLLYILEFKNIVIRNAIIVIQDAQNISCGNHELWSWF